MLSKDKAFKYARISKFIVGWGSHLYYIGSHPGVDGGRHRHFLLATSSAFFFPNFMSGSNPGSRSSMALVAVSLLILCCLDRRAKAQAHRRGRQLSPSGNVIQISTLVVFSMRLSAIAPTIPDGTAGFQYDSQTLATYTYQSRHGQGRNDLRRDSSGVPGCRFSTPPGASRFQFCHHLPHHGRDWQLSSPIPVMPLQ